MFHALAAPSTEEIADVATRTAQRVQKILARHGRTIDGAGESDAEDVFEIDVSTCPRCGGPSRWPEAATKPDASARLLAKQGLGPRPPPRGSAPRGQLRLALPGA